MGCGGGGSKQRNVICNPMERMEKGEKREGQHTEAKWKKFRFVCLRICFFFLFAPPKNYSPLMI